MYKLTKPQKLIYDMEKFSGGTIAVICASIICTGNKDITELKNAVKEIYNINAALRTRIIETDGQITQTILEFIEPNIEILHFTDKTEMEHFTADYAKIPLDFYGNLCEFKLALLPGHYALIAKLHHIIGDAWALSLIASQFCEILDGKTPVAYDYKVHTCVATDTKKIKIII